MNLLEKTVAELLDKFGEGNHKPGSGSAAAFQGMVASKLISTVIILTAEEKRRIYYNDCLPTLLGFQEKIEKEIFPQLSELFHLDSAQFDKTIQLRIARNAATDITDKNQLRRQALEELKGAIDIPLKIAALCVELAEMSAYVFDYGFKAARGDSQVGLSGAVSALAGCIAIIRLNVLSYNSDEYQFVKSVLVEVDKLEQEYQKLKLIAELKINILKEEFDRKIPLFDGIHIILNKYKGKKNINVEECVRELQNLVWKNRNVIWKTNPPDKLLDILKPADVLRQCLGYDYFLTGKFGVPEESGEVTEVGGLIDQNNKFVAVSKKFSEQTQRFTAAHELAHAILHQQSIMHRDLPTDCSGKRKTRDKQELEADKFASFFLMPTKQVCEVFFKIYSLPKFSLNEDTAFKFGGRSVSELKAECKSLRGLSKKLASATIYNGQSFLSMAEIFDVSVEAMAIRIEELDLVIF